MVRDGTLLKWADISQISLGHFKEVKQHEMNTFPSIMNVHFGKKDDFYQSNFTCASNYDHDVLNWFYAQLFVVYCS